MKFKTVFFFILTSLWACSNVKTGSDAATVSQERIIVPNTKAGKLFDQLRPESQKYMVNAGTDTVVTGKNGTLVFIPKNSFVFASGELVSGKIEVELIEVLSYADFVKTNLQTVSDGRILQSEGMFYIDARSNGKQVSLAKDKSLQIDLPGKERLTGSGIEIFTGGYNEEGNMNWSLEEKKGTGLIPLPLDLFQYVFRKSHKFVKANNANGFEISELAQLDNTTFTGKDLENTFIATREFEERFFYIWSASHLIGQFNSCYSKDVKSGIMEMDYTIPNIYLDNLDKDLSYSDSLSYIYYKDWYERTDTLLTRYVTIDREDVLKKLERFYKERLTNVIKFPADVDLNGNNVRENLLKRGFHEIEIDKILGAHQRRNDIITARKNRAMGERIFSNSFAIARLGWINCDQFFNDPKAKEANILAGISNHETYEFVSVIMIINGSRIAINGRQTDNGQFTFTGESAPYTRLPMAKSATIVAISYKDNRPYLGIKEIKISEKANYSIDLMPSSVKDIDNKLDMIQ